MPRARAHGFPNQKTRQRILRLVFLVTAIILFVVAVLLIELINTSLSSGGLLCSSVERMALGANFDVDFRRCGTGHESVAAVAGYSCLIILGMNSLSHFFLLTWTPDAGSNRILV